MGAAEQQRPLTFAERLAAGKAEGKHLCVGIDPHAHLLSEWGLPDSAAGAEEFGLAIVEAAAGRVLAVKPQIAFFERFGAAGYAALEQVLIEAREQGVLVIADVKRGDIGSTMEGYAGAWLTPGSPLEADAMTAVAYQGFGSLRAAFELAEEHGKGVFVLAATSNPEAKLLQQSRLADGRTVAQSVVDEANYYNQTHRNTANNAAFGSVGVVLGATLVLNDFDISTGLKAETVLPILAPGFGAQGAKLSEAKTIFGELRHGLIPNESRSVLSGGVRGLVERIEDRAMAVEAALTA